MKPDKVRQFVNRLNRSFGCCLSFANEKTDGSFTVIRDNYLRVLNVEKTHTGEYTVKFYPFLDMEYLDHMGEVWAVRESGYAMFKTATVRQLIASNYVGIQSREFQRNYCLLNHRNTDTTFRILILDNMGSAEFGALTMLTLIAQNEQLVAHWKNLKTVF